MRNSVTKNNTGSVSREAINKDLIDRTIKLTNSGMNNTFKSAAVDLITFSMRAFASYKYYKSNKDLVDLKNTFDTRSDSKIYDKYDKYDKYNKIFKDISNTNDLAKYSSTLGTNNNKTSKQDNLDISQSTSGISNPIIGYYYWCYNQSSTFNSWCSNVYGDIGSATWSSDAYTYPSDVTPPAGYIPNIIPGSSGSGQTPVNMMIFQYGTAVIGNYSNSQTTSTPAYGPGMLQYATYFPYGGLSPYQVALDYFSNTQQTQYRMGLMLGGGGPQSSSNPAYWTSGLITDISIALSNSATNAGALIYGGPAPTWSTNGFPTFNVLAFDIETGDAGLEQDFLNLFQQAQQLGFEIIVIINHSCSYGFTDALNLMQTLLPSPYVNYVSPELYTENIATMNEYVANTQLVWMDSTGNTPANETFVGLVQSNPNYNNGQMVIPSILLYNYLPNSQVPGLFYGAGTNNSNDPNWTTYDGSGSGCNCVYPQVGTPAYPNSTPPVQSNLTNNYPENFTTSPDPGANSFMCSLFGETSIGGCIQWVNGTYQG